jgi:hypothetical protein
MDNESMEEGAMEHEFRTEETVPAGSGEDLGDALIQDAFSGASGDQFAVRVWLDGESTGTFDYEITCSDENRFSLLVEHRPYTLDDGDPVDYVADWCAE